MTTDVSPRLSFRRRMEAAVRRYMADQALWPADGRLLVAVSGGPDSTALLLVLHRLARRRGLHLAVAHFDHGLRGAAVAAREARFVGDLAATLGLPLHLGSGDVRALAKAERLSLEEAARRARYGFLAEAAEGAGSGLLATRPPAPGRGRRRRRRVPPPGGGGGLGRGGGPPRHDLVQLEAVAAAAVVGE